MDMPPTWIPRLAADRRSRYLAIVDALAADIQSGALPRGTQLLPQRDMAEQLALSVGTVAKAYAEAGRRGLISGEIGRGTFVGGSTNKPATEAAAPHRPIDMTLNAPPNTGEETMVAAALAGLAREDPRPLLGYLPHAGILSQRHAVASWISENFRLRLPAERVMLSNGAQHAIAVCMMAASPPGAPILAEAVTYPGLFGLSGMLGHPLHGVAMDTEGLIPDALDAAFERTGARMLYCMPTLQTPTGATMSIGRRQAIASVLRHHDALAVEDDVYGFLASEAPPPLAVYAPERVCYVTSFAKCAAPGLRLGALAVPEDLRDRATAALRATGWMASPLLGALATRMIQDGSLSMLVGRKRAAATERMALAREILGPAITGTAGSAAFHLWLPLNRPVAEVIAEAAMLGVVVAPPAQLPDAEPIQGIRICLGAPESLGELRTALVSIAAVLRGTESRSHV